MYNTWLIDIQTDIMANFGKINSGTLKTDISIKSSRGGNFVIKYFLIYDIRVYESKNVIRELFRTNVVLRLS